MDNKINNNILYIYFERCFHIYVLITPHKQQIRSLYICLVLVYAIIYFLNLPHLLNIKKTNKH